MSTLTASEVQGTPKWQYVLDEYLPKLNEAFGSGIMVEFQLKMAIIEAFYAGCDAGRESLFNRLQRKDDTA